MNACERNDMGEKRKLYRERADIILGRLCEEIRVKGNLLKDMLDQLTDPLSTG